MELEKVTKPRKGYDLKPNCEQRNGTNVKARLLNGRDRVLRVLPEVGECRGIDSPTLNNCLLTVAPGDF